MQRILPASMSPLLSQEEEGLTERIIRKEQQAYGIEGLEDYADEVDTLDEGFYSSILSLDLDQNAVPVKAERSLSSTSGVLVSSNSSNPKMKRTKAKRTKSTTSTPQRRKSAKSYTRPILRKSQSASTILTKRELSPVPVPPVLHHSHSAGFEPPKYHQSIKSISSNYNELNIMPAFSQHSTASNIVEENDENGSSKNEGDSFQTFPSPFTSPFTSVHSRLSIGDFNSPEHSHHNAKTTTVTASAADEEEEKRRRRRIKAYIDAHAAGDAFEPIISDTDNLSFQNSMKLVDLLSPSDALDDSFRPTRSMPELLTLLDLESSSKKKKEKTKLTQKTSYVRRGSTLVEEAMEIDPFDDDCVHFEHKEEPAVPTIHTSSTIPTSDDVSSSNSNVDLVAQMQVVQQQHAQQLDKLTRQIENGNKMITSLTQQVQDLMIINEKLTAENKKLKDAKRKRIQKRRQSSARISMDGNVLESSRDADSPITAAYQTEDSEMEFTDQSDLEIEKLSKSPKSPKTPTKNKRKVSKSPKRRKSSTKKVNPPKRSNSTSTFGSMTMSLKDADNNDARSTTSERSSMSNKKNKNKQQRKNKRGSKKPHSCSSLMVEGDEHPLSIKAKRRKSMEEGVIADTIDSSISVSNNQSPRSVATIATEDGADTSSRRSIGSSSRRSTLSSFPSKRLTETIETIWGLDWKNNDGSSGGFESKKSKSKQQQQQRDDDSSPKSSETNKKKKPKGRGSGGVASVVGKLQKKKSKRKSGKSPRKSKQATNPSEVNYKGDDYSSSRAAKTSSSKNNNPTTKSPIKNAAGLLGAIKGRLLTPSTSDKRRRRSIKAEMQAHGDDSNMAVPEL